MIPITEIAANRIREARKDQRLSQDDLAKRVGLTRVTISHIENGQRKSLKPEVIRKFAQVLNQPEAYFYGEVTKSMEALPSSLKDAVERLFDLPHSQQEKLGSIIGKIVDWYESEVNI